MHIEVFDIVVIWLLVVVGAESSEAFVAEPGFDWVDSSYQDIESAVELLLVDDQRVVYVPLGQVLVVESRLGQVCKLLEQNDSITTSSFGRFSYESLPWVLSHMMFEISNFVWQQERVRHKFVVYGKESLET